MSTLPPAGEPGRLHRATLLVGPIRQLRDWAFPLLVTFVLGLGSDSLSGLEIVVGAIVATFLIQLVAVLRVRWWLSDEAFHLRKGLIGRQERTLPLDRIHNVDVTQQLLARFFGVASVKVESGGSSQTDISLEYIGVEMAEALRASLAQVSETEAAESEPIEPKKPLVKTPISELFVAGATANRVGALAASAAALVGVLFEAGIEPEVLIDFAGDFARPTLWFGIGLVFASVFVGWVVSIVQSVIRFYEFTLVLDGDEARRTHGLLTKVSGRIPLPRVQAVRVEEPWLRRWIGRATIVAETAGSVAAGSEGGTGVVSPIEPVSRVPELASVFLGRPGTTTGGLIAVSRIAIRRGFVRALVPGVLLSVAAAVVVDPWWGLATVAWAAPSWWWANQRWRSIGYRLDDDLLVARDGVFKRRTWLVPTAKVQAVWVRQTLLQRRWNLADLGVATAASGSGTVRVIELDLSVARSLAEGLSTQSADTAFASSDGV